MTNSLRDIGTLPAAAEAMKPLAELMQLMHDTLAIQWKRENDSALLRLALDFSTWKTLRRAEGMASKDVLGFWIELIQCDEAAPVHS